ncbi:MAG: replication-relaxation family protein [Beijerinckiaceae bacterium]
MDETHKPSRRSQLKRTAIAKNLQITDRDIFDIFEPLSRHSQLTTRQLVAFGTRYPTITKARLSHLWHATEGKRTHWLHRVNEDVPMANHLFTEDMHRLGAEAETLLQAKGIIPNEPWVAAARIGGNSKSPSRIIRLAHDHMASQIAIDIEIGVKSVGLQYRSHVDILHNAPLPTRTTKRPLQLPVTIDGQYTSIEPDALFAIGDKYYALEADRGTESITGVIVPKLKAYREVVADHIIDDHLAIDNLTVLFAMTNGSRMRNAMDELGRIARDGRSAMFGFRVFQKDNILSDNAIPRGEFTRLPWTRVGLNAIALT